MNKHTYSFPKSSRLRKRWQYQRMRHGTFKYVGQWILIDIRVIKENISKVGITVTKRYGPAHIRNRFKRLVREAFRLSSAEFIFSCDILVRPRSQALQASMQDIQKEILSFITLAFQQVQSQSSH